jgi:hypothetical protein
LDKKVHGIARQLLKDLGQLVFAGDLEGISDWFRAAIAPTEVISIW